MPEEEDTSRRLVPRDLNCAMCGRPMTEVLEAVVATGKGRQMPMMFHPDGTVQLVCGACDPGDGAIDEVAR